MERSGLGGRRRRRLVASASARSSVIGWPSTPTRSTWRARLLSCTARSAWIVSGDEDHVVALPHLGVAHRSAASSGVARRVAGGARPVGRPRSVVTVMSATPPSSSSPCGRSAASTRPTARCCPDITLAFYPGAKIGVIGPNGSGKSSLLRIMAGVDDGFTGEARLSPGFTVGPARAGAAARRVQGRQGQRDGRRGRGGRPARALRRGAGQVRRPRRRLREDRRRAGRARSQDPGGGRRRPRPPDRDRHGRAAAPARRRRRHHPLRRREAPRGAVPAAARPSPTCCCSTSPPTTSTPSRWRGSSGRCATTTGTVVAITHDRYFLDNVARWILELERGKGHPFEGNYSSWLEQKQRPPRGRGEERLHPTPHARARARVGAHGAEGPPGQGQGPPGRLRQAPGRGRGGRARPGQAPDPAARRSAPRRRRDRGRRRRQGLRRPPAHRRPHLQAAARRHRRRDRPERRRQDHPVPHDHRPGAARRRHLQGRRHRRPRLRRPEPRQPRPREHRLRGDHRQHRVHEGRQPRGQRPRLRQQLQLQGLRPAEEGRPALRRRAQPRAPRQDAQGGRQRPPPRRADQRPRRRHAPRPSRTRSRRSPAARW